MKKWLSAFIVLTSLVASREKPIQNMANQIVDNEATGKPNIVLIVADDHGMNDLGCYGNEAISTPNLDALASEGIRFTRAYATTPSCTASRSVILSGLYNHLNGLFGHEHGYHHFRAHEFLKSLPVYLEEIGGYQTARIGKYHVAPQEVFRFQEVLEANGRNTVAMADTAGAYIHQTENPFFLYFCTQDPHRSGDVNEENPYQPNRFGNREEGYSGVEDYSISPEEVIVPWYLPDLPETRAELVEYYQSVNRVDQGVGRLFQHLKESEKWDNTVVIYISDNGIAFQGAKTNIYEPGINLPCIVKHTNSKNGGTVSEAVINWSDLTPTILDLAGILDESTQVLKKSFANANYQVSGQQLQSPIASFHGQSFKAVLDSEVKTARTENHISHTFHEITMYYPMRSIMDGDYKLIWNIAYRLPYPHASDLWASATWQGALKSENQVYGNKTIDSYTHRPEFNCII
ncbi:MAG: sulfatase [Bacteroidota bacterium]